MVEDLAALLDVIVVTGRLWDVGLDLYRVRDEKVAFCKAEVDNLKNLVIDDDVKDVGFTDLVLVDILALDPRSDADFEWFIRPSLMENAS